MNDRCNLETCRYNQSGKCTNEKKRKECVDVSRKVLCLGDKENINKRKKRANNFSVSLPEKRNR